MAKGKTLKAAKEKKKELPKSYPLYVPQNLNIDELIEKYPPQFDFEFKKDELLYIVSLLISIAESLKNNQEYQKNAAKQGYVPIHSSAAQQKVRNYNSYLNYLVSSGVLETDGKYSKDSGKSTWFRFTSEYSVGIKQVLITKRSIINQLVNKTRPTLQEDKILPETPLSVLSYLTKWFDSKLKIDFDEADKFLLSLMEIDKEELGHRSAIQRYNSRCITVYKIKNGEFENNFTIDRTGGRFYSPLTSLKRELKQFLSYDGKKLVGLDLKSSQPFLSLVLIEKDLFDRNGIIDILPPYYRYAKFKNEEIETRIQDITNCIELCKDYRDMLEYRESVLNGTIYEDVGSYNGAYLIFKQEPERRQNAKDAFIPLFFGKNVPIYPKDYNDRVTWKDNAVIFSSFFPSVDKIFRTYKEKSYETLSRVLQFIEAKLILHIVCKTIAEETPDIPLFTIHDSILTTENYADHVQDRMLTIIDETIGIRPRIKKEIY